MSQADELIRRLDKATKALEQIHLLTHERMRDVRNLIHSLSEPWHTDHSENPSVSAKRIIREALPEQTINLSVDDAVSMKTALTKYDIRTGESNEITLAQYISMARQLAESVRSGLYTVDPTPLVPENYGDVELPEPQTDEQMKEKLARFIDRYLTAGKVEPEGVRIPWRKWVENFASGILAILRPEPEVLRNTFVAGAVAGGTMARKLTGNTEWRAWLEAEIKQRYAKAEPGKEKEG
jgi:hypothetical protein